LPAEMTPALRPEDIEKERSYLLRYALLQLRSPAQAEDAVQETLLAALEGRERFGGRSSLRTWLTGILKHKIIDQFRRQQRETPLESPDDFAEETPGMEEFFAEDGHWSEPPQTWGDPGGLLQQDQFLQTLQDLKITPTNAWVMLYRARMGLRKCLELNWLGGH